MRFLAVKGRGTAMVEATTLLLSIFIIAICGLTFELLIGSLSSYLLGDSVFYFSLTIGLFMSSMGLGSYLSRWINRDLLHWFISIEIAIGLSGGFAAFILYTAFASANKLYTLVMLLVILVIGTLIGLELPLLTRIVKHYGTFKDVLASVLSFDYIGALVASLLFPLVLLPYLGLVKTSFFVGVLNLLVVFANLYIFRGSLRSWGLYLASILAFALLLVGLITSSRLVSVFEQQLYQDEILYSAQTRYQRIIVTKWKDDLRLFLDGAIQFSSRDEYRYHEALVHPAFSLAHVRENVLILGGGDGLAAREILKYDDVKKITLVDIDPEMTSFATSYQPVVELNEGSLLNPKVRIVNEDAFKYLEDSTETYDVVIVDFPDPRSERLSKLFSLEFYRLLKHQLSRGGIVAVQSTSPYFARQAFWSINKTMEAAGFYARPYHTAIPSFGDWGFNLASDLALEERPLEIEVPVRFATTEAVEKMFFFESDIKYLPVEINTLDSQALMRYYGEAWKKWRSR